MIGKAAKVLITLVKTENGRKLLKNALIIILSPLIILILAYSLLQDATAKHNNKVIDVLFNGAEITQDTPDEFKSLIKKITLVFDVIDKKIESFENVEGKFDNTFVKSILFQSFLIDEKVLENINTDDYLALFYTQEEKEVEIEIDDEASPPMVETKTFIKPIQDTDLLLIEASNHLGVDVKPHKESLYELYYVALIGNKNGFEDTKPLSIILEEAYIESEKKEYVGGSFGSPFNGEWQDFITSEFGPRTPITLPDGSVTGNYHYGIDLGLAFGTPLLSVNKGEVVAAKHTNGDFGFYVLIDHGGGVFSFYAHLSKISVEENMAIEKGELIGEVGSTGKSTAPHLHLEVIENRTRVNPRRYLPKRNGG